MVWNSDLVETLELDNLLALCCGVDSCGRQPRPRAAVPMPARTIPERDDENWMKHTLAWLNGDGDVRIDYRPVHSYTLTDEVEHFPPKKRVY